MELIVHFCDEKRPDRLNEYLTCIRANLINPAIVKVHCLKKDTIILPVDVSQDRKIKITDIDHRPTFAELINYANIHIKFTTAAIINLDIILDPASDWFELQKVLIDNPFLVLALSRHEFDPDRGIFIDPTLGLFNHALAQDGWFFRTPVTLSECEFEIGTLGADNAIADRFRKAGLYPLNLGSRYKLLHYDKARGKHGGNAVHVHAKDSEEFGEIYSRYPEDAGYFLVPDFDKTKGIDAFLDIFQIDEMSRYNLICEMMSKLIKVNNRVL